MFTTLRVPKMVEIRNPRLLMVFYVLQTCCVAFLLSWFITAKFWESSDQVGSFIHGTISVQGSDDTSSVEQRLAELRASTCKKFESYEYWQDAGGKYRWQNISCVAPCKKGQKEGCVGFAESFMEKDEGEVFIPTHRRIITSGHDWHDQEGQDSVLLSAEALTLVLSYHYDLPQFTWDGSHRIPSVPSSRESASSTQSITTILVDASGNRHTIPPGQEIAFTVQRLLELSGNKDALNDPHATAGANQRPGSAGEPPLAWLSGLELEMLIECTGSGGKTLTCYLGVRQTERAWTHERTVDLHSRSGEHEVRVHHGIRVFMRGGGMRTHFHLATLISKLTSSWVLLLLPRKLVFFVTITVLGHLSTIYQQAAIDRFKLKDYLAGMSARLLVWNAAFVELQDATLPNGNRGISKRRLHERLRAVLSHRGDILDGGDVRHLVECCHKAMASCSGRGRSAVISSLRDMTKEIRNIDSGESSRCIDSDRFSVACTSFEHINLDAVVTLFDKDRRRWFLERVFTPNNLRKYIFTEDSAFEDADSPPPEEDGATPRSAAALGVLAPSEDACTESTNACDKSSDVYDTRCDALAEHESDGRALTLEEEMERQRALSGRVAHLAREHERLREKQEAHSRQLEESRLALQSMRSKSRECAEAVKELKRDVSSHHESTQLAGRECTEAVMELKRDVDSRHKSIHLALQAASEKLKVSTGEHGESMCELRRAMDAKHAALEGRQDRLQELCSAIDALQRPLEQRMGILETTLQRLCGAIDELRCRLAQRAEGLDAMPDPGAQPRAELGTRAPGPSAAHAEWALRWRAALSSAGAQL